MATILSLLLLALATAAAAAPPRVENGTARLSNGVHLPLVSLGTGDSVNQTRTNLEAALDAGFRAVDTALIYFDQSGVAEAIRDEIGKYERREIFITTKVPGGGAGVDNYKSTLLDAKVNLALLKVDYVDLLLVHWSPLAGCGNCEAIRDQWRAMEDIYFLKQARAIGVSNYCKACFECLEGHATTFPMVNQIEYHVGMGPGAQTYATELIEYMRRHDVQPMAYSPLGPTFNATEKNELIEGNLTNSIGKKHGKSGAQVALRYVIQSGLALATRSDNPAYLAEDIDVYDWALTEPDMRALGDAKEPDAPTGGGKDGGPCLFCHD